MPVWIFHGSRDENVPVSVAHAIAGGLQQHGREVYYTEFPRWGHNAWEPAYEDVELWYWLTSGNGSQERARVCQTGKSNLVVSENRIAIVAIGAVSRYDACRMRFHNSPLSCHYACVRTRSGRILADMSDLAALVREFVDTVGKGSTEIYNEFSLQHELGIFLRGKIPAYKVQFERNIRYFTSTHAGFVKREIDISIFSPDKTELKYAID